MGGVACDFTVGGSTAAQCPPGCTFSAAPTAGTMAAATCAPNPCPNFSPLAPGAVARHSVDMGEFRWALDSGAWFSLALALGVGANSVATSYAPAVSAGAITPGWASVLALPLEALGALVLGRHLLPVTNPVLHHDIIDISTFNDDPEALLVGGGCAALAAAIWVLLATWAGVPVSATHATLGT